MTMSSDIYPMVVVPRASWFLHTWSMMLGSAFITIEVTVAVKEGKKYEMPHALQDTNSLYLT